MYCDFVSKLRTLKKSSAESVDNALVENEFKRYMHVNRKVEDEFRNVISQVNANQSKCLVLLCGSAGDGKSHMLSYLKYFDDNEILKGYELYNDATESEAPNMTAIDTLAKVLDAFSDANIGDGIEKKLIVAINIGTLINFVASEQGKCFKQLGEYVRTSGIASENNIDTGYLQGSIFQYVSFSDYQVFTLKRDDVGIEFLEQLFDKIFSENDDNPFYTAYKENTECAMATRCPVRMNYELLMDKNVQKAVIRRIVEVVIEDKAIVSTREVLNIIYELLVHPDFDYSTLCNVAPSDIKYLTQCVPWTTPMLLNEFEDISPLLDCIRKHDVLKYRHEQMDKDTTSFHAMENIEEVFDTLTAGTPYESLSAITKVAVLGGIKPELKRVVYRFLVRLHELTNEKETKQSRRLKEYIKYLYFNSCGCESELGKLYEMTKNAIMSWEGFFADGNICIDGTNEMYWLVEQISLEPCVYGLSEMQQDEIHRFFPSIKLRFYNSSNAGAGSEEIVIDYSLFELMSDMEEGYRPTVQDKNHLADFDSFVRRITDLGNKKTKVTIIAKNNTSEKYLFEKDPFGKYTFKVV